MEIDQNMQALLGQFLPPGTVEKMMSDTVDLTKILDALNKIEQRLIRLETLLSVE